MKLGTRIFFCYLLIFLVCFFYPLNWILDNLRTRYLEGVEDPLVDQANIMAAMVEQEMETGKFDPEKLFQAFQRVYDRDLCARIYQIVKDRVDTRVYITDKTGTIIFDSQNKDLVGQDYSHWRDVKLTLSGEYGARTSLDDQAENPSSVLYVSAPILVKDEIAGVLTIAKPTIFISDFLRKAKPQIIRTVLLSVIAAILLSYFVSGWLTTPIRRLTAYAAAVGEGKRSDFPKLDSSEIGKMGKAFEKMQETLQGKKYVEQYVQNLTHEIKSPLSAIRGAAELLREKMPSDQRHRFLTNIHNEANRIQVIVDRMLKLSSLENLKRIEKRETISLNTLIKSVMESKGPLLSEKKVSLLNGVPKDILVKGDSFLLHQAFSNLIQNAIDFSPEHSQIEITAQGDDKKVQVKVTDHGDGIPDYAMEKIFDKFFSLKRPDTGKKSTGLGLNFVKEVVTLHNGEIKLTNEPAGGICATLRLPS